MICKCAYRGMSSIHLSYVSAHLAFRETNTNFNRYIFSPEKVQTCTTKHSCLIEGILGLTTNLARLGQRNEYRRDSNSISVIRNL